MANDTLGKLLGDNRWSGKIFTGSWVAAHGGTRDVNGTGHRQAVVQGRLRRRAGHRSLRRRGGRGTGRVGCDAGRRAGAILRKAAALLEQDLDGLSHGDRARDRRHRPQGPA